MEPRESRCPEPLSEFSDLYKHRKMPCKSALNFGENSEGPDISNFFPECPTTYSNPEVMNQATNSLVEAKQLNSFSSPVGDLERTIENFRISHESNWNTNSIFTPTNSGSLELFLLERRDSPATDCIKNFLQTERFTYDDGDGTEHRQGTGELDIERQSTRQGMDEIELEEEEGAEIQESDQEIVGIKGKTQEEGKCQMTAKRGYGEYVDTEASVERIDCNPKINSCSASQVCHKLERISSSKIINRLNCPSEIDTGDVPLVDFDQFTQLQY